MFANDSSSVFKPSVISGLGSGLSALGVFLCSGGTIRVCSDNFSASNTAILSASLIPSSVISDIS